MNKKSAFGVQRELLSRLRHARYRTDQLFQTVRPHALYERPIAERHRIVFYLGHMEAFDWNLICDGAFGMTSFNADFDRLFAFGIDPTSGNLPDDRRTDWPKEEEIHCYNRRVRDAVDQCLVSGKEEELFRVAIEHRLMHAETLAYMLHWPPHESKSPKPVLFDAGHRKPRYGQIDIPGGEATLGMKTGEGHFGWDNEFEEHCVAVPAFSIDRYKVTNGQYAEFVRAGGYQEPTYWSAAAWTWITRSGISHPKFWKQSGKNWLCRSMFGDIPFQPAWPVYVSHAEAQAYARWRRKSLPTEAQFHRAAYGTPAGKERAYPWGNASPQTHHGNFNFARWNPSPVDAHPNGDSAFAVADMVGNGWEWTSTPFEPFDGFQAFPFYKGYSANFFDSEHYVLKGASPRTAACLLRRSFRNWYQSHYPNIYASFRCVEN